MSRSSRRIIRICRDDPLIMDCVARDSEGKQFDVEIQQDNEGASPKRARYHSGLMDMNTLNQVRI